MAYYIKANRLVAEYLKVDKIRLKLSDGNYMLWQADIQAFGRLYEIKQICERIGAIALQPWEAKQEQDGTVVRQLPEATDKRFVLPVEEETADEVIGESAEDNDTEDPTEELTDKSEGEEVNDE